MKSSEAALHWIIGKLNGYNTPYQVVGGLAAIAYGSKRELADIDLYISFKTSQEFMSAILPFISWGPEHQRDEYWDLTYLKINFEGQKIEIGDSNNAHIFDQRISAWVSQEIDYNIFNQKMIYGCLINVMPLDRLIHYKSALGRDVDKQDIQQIAG